MKEYWYFVFLGVLLIISFVVSILNVVDQTPRSRKRFKAAKLENNKPCLEYLDALRNDNYWSYSVLNASIAVFVLFIIFIAVYATRPSLFRGKGPLFLCLFLVSFIVLLFTTYKIFNCYFHRSLCGSSMCQSTTD